MAVHVLHLLPDFAIGGGQQVVLDLVGNRSAGVTATVAGIGTAATLASEFQDQGARVEVLRLEERGWLRVIADVFSLIRKTKVDILHVHVGRDRRIGQLVALLTRTPVVSHIHGVHDHLDRRSTAPGFLARTVISLRQRSHGAVERRTVRRYIAVSDAVFALHESRRHVGVDVIVNGIRTDRFSPNPEARSAWRESIGVSPDDLVVLNLGRMVRYKGQIKILDVFQDCPGVLVLVGDGPEREPIKVRVDELGLKDRVRILPFTRDVSPIYAGSDVFVMSSGPQEGLVLVVLEAMSCGLPVLALRTPAMEQVIDHGVTGILMDHLSELPVILKTLSTGDLHQLGVSARSKVQSDHTALAMTRKVEAIYREVLAAKRYRAPRIKKVGGPPH